jgi:HD-GYP domain-containing protein (c-di-GMP phosphodiesterase class II)
MHDVGKIGTPDRILTKPGPLTKEEFDVIKQHVHRGYDIANTVPALKPVAEAIRCHHEKYDGNGYPLGLKGDSIPLLARIVAVADAYDAMTSGRVYQPSISPEEAIQELRRCSGGHFDPACVHAFMAAMVRSGAAGLPPVSVRPWQAEPIAAA